MVLLYNSFFKANSSRIVASAHFLLGKILSVEGQLTLAICIVNWWFSTHSYKLLMMPKILFEQNHKKKTKEQLRFSSVGRSNWQKNFRQRENWVWKVNNNEGNWMPAAVSSVDYLLDFLSSSFIHLKLSFFFPDPPLLDPSFLFLPSSADGGGGSGVL